MSRIESVKHKAGRTGDLLFVLVRHEIRNARGLALTEEHDIVYRAMPQAGDPVAQPLAAERDAAWQREIVPDEVLLFRYSALTFNGHRIHYDRRYVTEVEGYPGLVVHGPLHRHPAGRPGAAARSRCARAPLRLQGRAAHLRPAPVPA